MRALALDFESRTAGWREEAEARPPGRGEVLFEVHQVGICGTDRELARFSFGEPPPGESHLVLGHEALGRVVETGADVRGLKPGDWVVPVVRRSCTPPCRCCAAGRRDLCLTGGYRERGITGVHGYFTSHALDAAEDLIRVPEAALDYAVLVEPLSVVEKAVEAARRAHPERPESAVVLGAGPIGLLAAMVLHVGGMPVTVCSREDSDNPRVRWLKEAGIPYATPERPPARAGIVIEAAGNVEAAGLGLRLLGPQGVLVVIGAPEVPPISGYRLIVHNLTVLGVVNAAPAHFELGLSDLAKMDRRWLGQIVERRAAASALESLAGPTAVPKVVHILAE